MRVLDLFSGIGGMSLGLQRAGMTTVAFCEIDPFCRRVLAKHWPETPIYDDVRTLTAARLAADGVVFDLICGGFPCQDLSVAGKGAGLSGERSGLWFEFRRIIEETRPGWTLIENVPALRSRGLDIVLGGLAALGYDAEWHCIPASAVGAHHQRDRLWIVAYADNGKRIVAREDHAVRTGRYAIGGGGANVAYANGVEQQVQRATGRVGRQRRSQADVVVSELGRIAWGAEPDVGRVANGVPSRVDRLRALGNAVVPQVVELIGRAIMARQGAVA